MNKSFIHREILHKPTENKDYIFAINNTLVYYTNQVWSAFDNNDIEQFLISLYNIQKCRRLFLNPLNLGYKNKIEQALKEWIKVFNIKGDSIDIENFFICIEGEPTKTKIDTEFLTSLPNHDDWCY